MRPTEAITNRKQEIDKNTPPNSEGGGDSASAKGEFHLDSRRQYLILNITSAVLDLAGDVLSEKEGTVLKGIMLGKSYNVIGQEMNLTDERARQIGKEATNKLLKFLRSGEKPDAETLPNKSIRTVFAEDKTRLTSAASHLLEEVIEMAPQLGVFVTPLNMSALMLALKSYSYKQVSNILGCSPTIARKYAIEGIEEIKKLPDCLNRQLEKIASSPQKEDQSSDDVMSEKLRLIMNSSLRDLPGSDKNSAILTLEHYDIHTVGDLCSRHRSEIEEIRALRSKMNNIDKLLTDLGLTYGMKI